jgi:TDG/mug DNA glycosylase family protein
MIVYKISRNAKILFVGINPHPGSYRRGVPFSNNKMFWYLLNRAGLLNEAEADLQNDESLKQLYDERFVRKYALNFVNLVDRPTIDVTELEKGEEQAGIERAMETILDHKPKVVCFIGKVTLNKFRGSRACNYGWQKNIGNIRVYLMHFPIRGPAAIRVRELREVKRASGRTLRLRKGKVCGRKAIGRRTDI